jgi:TrmH family RNA methyltransferase
LRALRQRKTREAEGRFVAEGVRVVEELLQSPLTVLWAAVSSSLEDSERGRALVEGMAARGVPVEWSSEAEFATLAATETPQGVLAVAEVPASRMDQLLRSPTPCVLLVLDAVQDPGNFGTLVRSAEALGAAGVIALPGTVDPWNAKSIRAAMGSSFRLPIVAAEWATAASALRASGFRLLAAAAGGHPAPRGLQRAALVVGNEGAGISDAVRAEVDETVGIPLRGRAESLNVAAAAAILLHELTR